MGQAKHVKDVIVGLESLDDVAMVPVDLQVAAPIGVPILGKIEDISYEPAGFRRYVVLMQGKEIVGTVAGRRGLVIGQGLGNIAQQAIIISSAQRGTNTLRT